MRLAPITSPLRDRLISGERHPLHRRATQRMPTALRVDLGGLEPPTSSLSGKRSNRLSYRSIDSNGTLTVMATHEPNAPCRPAVRRLLEFGQRDVEAADQAGRDVVREGGDGSQRREQHDVECADQQRAEDDDRPAEVDVRRKDI